ncbi:hypothetical protein ACFLXJ_01445 [Chloroflexota bacterium]
MKSPLILLTALILAICPLVGCSGEAKPTIEPVETITTSVNSEFSTTREFNLVSGYMWREDYNEDKLELSKSSIDVIKEGEQEDAPLILIQVFQFKALKKGTTYITLIYQRAALDGPMIARQEVIRVDIK